MWVVADLLRISSETLSRQARALVQTDECIWNESLDTLRAVSESPQA